MTFDREGARKRCEVATEFSSVWNNPKVLYLLLRDLPAALDELDAKDAKIARLTAELAATPCWCKDCRWYTPPDELGDRVCVNDKSDWCTEWPEAHCSCEYCERGELP